MNRKIKMVRNLLVRNRNDEIIHFILKCFLINYIMNIKYIIIIFYIVYNYTYLTSLKLRVVKYRYILNVKIYKL